VHDVACKQLVLGSREPLRQRDSTIKRIIDRFSIERRRLHHLPGPRMSDLTPRADENHRFAAEVSELRTSFGPHAREEGREAVVVGLAVLLERMMVTLRALQADPEKQLRRRFREI